MASVDHKMKNQQDEQRRLEADSLLLWNMDADANQRAIEGGKVKGVIKKESFKNLNTITDTTENVARFVADAGDSLFSSKVIRLERVK